MRPSYRYFTQFPLRPLFSTPHPRLICASRLPFKSPCRLVSNKAIPGFICHGERGTAYRLIRPLGSQIHSKPPHIWLAVDYSNPDIQYVIKQPSGNNENALSAFNHELEMQRVFEKEAMIRKIVDYIPNSEHVGSMIVLEAFTDSLWEARNARSFTEKEIKWIMKAFCWVSLLCI
ncbi:hypothetical protein AWENTII_010874 [Aspergillus wentii]